MEDTIKIICEALKEEAEAVYSYTNKISDINLSEEPDKSTAQLLETLRLDEVEHIQNLTLKLTEILTSGMEPPSEVSEDE